MKVSLCTVLIHYIVLCNIVHHDAEGSRTRLASVEENLELEKQLKILNKPRLKSFKKNGDIIDCVDIYKQPAFDHPLLSNHKFQRRPTSLPKGMRLTARKYKTTTTESAENEFEGCPHGSVPFRRIQKEDLINAKALVGLKRLANTQSSNAAIPPDFHYAAVTTPVNDTSRKFYGAKTAISVYNVTEIIQDTQFTEALLWLGSAVDGPYNSIEYGWTANPQLYGDRQSRTYSYWTADGGQNTGCFNALCPGYVQVSTKRFMGDVNTPESVFGETVYAMEFNLFRDPNTSNWWLFETIDNQTEAVGYWPKELFPAMADSASVVQLGGKVYSPSTLFRQAPMGSGAFVEDDFTRTCYASNIEFVDSDYQFYEPKDVFMQETADEPDVYTAKYLGDAGKEHPSRHYTFLFGGPGHDHNVGSLNNA